MRNHKTLLGLCIVALLCLEITLALEVEYETTAVGRIVGDSPEIMLGNLKATAEDMQIADYFGFDNINHNPDTYTVLEQQFEGNIGYLGQWYTKVHLENSLSDKSSKRLVIVNDKGELKNGVPRMGGLYPDDTRGMLDSFSEKNPFIILNADYAGLYLPNKESFVSNLNYGSPLISSTFFSDDEFLKALVCSLSYEGSFTIGDVFKNARNRYYWGVHNIYASDPMIPKYSSSLALISYLLYSNPRSKFSVPDRILPPDYREYCEPYFDRFDLDGFFSTYAQSESFDENNINFELQSMINNLYTQTVEFNIDSYEIESKDNYSVLSFEGSLLSQDTGQVVLPSIVKPTMLPLRTLVTNITLLSLEEPVDITVPEIPEWDEGFVNRTCAGNLTDAGVEYAHSFTEDNEAVLVTLNPAEVLDCEQGILRLYRKITYRIDYLPYSPVLIDFVHYPDELIPEQQGTVYVALKNIKTEPAIGSLVLKDGDEVIAEKNISMGDGTQTFNIDFTAPEEEGLRTYTVGFKQDDEIKTETSFRINIDLLSADLLIPKRVGASTTILLRLYNKLSEPLNIQVDHYLEKDDRVLDSGSLSRTLTPGVNMVDISYSNLKKADQSYSLAVDLLYANRKEVLSGSLITNHPPILGYIPDIIVGEGRPVVINTSAVDFDYDYLTYSISDPVGDDGIWYPDYDSAGNYSVTVAVSDGYATDSQEIHIQVNDKNDSRKVIFRDCNYGIYRGGFAEIALDSDFDDYLESWYSNSQFEELDQHFGYRTNEGWPLGTCLHASDLICIEDSDSSDPDWYISGDSYPDPKFEQGGICDTDSIPNPLYKGHEICEGNIGCDYPMCVADLDCGVNEWVGDYYCANNTVYHDYRNHSCVYPGTYSSDCVYTDVPLLMESCTAAQECHDGQCIDIACYADSDCGNDGYLGAYCTETGIYNDNRTWTCENSGTAFASCSYTDKIDYVTSCNTDQICVYGECVDKNFYILGTFEDGSLEKEIKYLVAGNETVYIHIPKHSEIRNATLKVGGGK